MAADRDPASVASASHAKVSRATTRVCGDGERSGGGVDGYGARSHSVARKMKYRQYLLTDEWKKKRTEARRRAGYRCRVCGATTRLETHHKTYKDLGAEKQHQLVILCGAHHEACHRFIREWKVAGRKRGWKKRSDYSLTMKFIARERANLRKKGKP